MPRFLVTVDYSDRVKYLLFAETAEEAEKEAEKRFNREVVAGEIRVTADARITSVGQAKNLQKGYEVKK